MNNIFKRMDRENIVQLKQFCSFKYMLVGTTCIQFLIRHFCSRQVPILLIDFVDLVNTDFHLLEYLSTSHKKGIRIQDNMMVLY